MLGVWKYFENVKLGCFENSMKMYCAVLRFEKGVILFQGIFQGCEKCLILLGFENGVKSGVKSVTVGGRVIMHEYSIAAA